MTTEEANAILRAVLIWLRGRAKQEAAKAQAA